MDDTMAETPNNDADREVGCRGELARLLTEWDAEITARDAKNEQLKRENPGGNGSTGGPRLDLGVYELRLRADQLRNVMKQAG